MPLLSSQLMVENGKTREVNKKIAAANIFD